MSPIAAESGIRELSLAEGRELVERAARESLGISLAEFERAYEEGKLDPEDPDVIVVALLLPFAR